MKVTNEIRDFILKFGITICGPLGEGKKQDQTKAMVREIKWQAQGEMYLEGF